jgi:hypothetical protein
LTAAVETGLTPTRTPHAPRQSRGCRRELDALLLDPRYLLAAEPTRLLSVLQIAGHVEAQHAAHAYRHALGDLRTKPEEEHNAYLQLAARCAGATQLADRIARSDLPRPWSVQWARWRMNHAYRLRRHADTISAVAMDEAGSVIIAGGWDGSVSVWEPATATRFTS